MGFIKNGHTKTKKDGSNQWQDGYPNMQVVKNDIHKKYGYVLTLNNEIVGYCALLINDEPDYINIEGQWLTSNNFVVFHRLAISKNFLTKDLQRKWSCTLSSLQFQKIYSVLKQIPTMTTYQCLNFLSL